MIATAPGGRLGGWRLEQGFAASAVAHPDGVALIHRGDSFSYREIDRRANRLAHHLRALGVGREMRVAIALDRSPSLVIGLLAILKAGGAYVPIDPAYPADRRAFMLDDSRAAVLLTDGSAPVSSVAGATCDLTRAAPAIAVCPDEPPTPLGDHRDLAAIIYTSGSTGRPKGVMLEHSAASLIDWLATTLPPGSLSRVAATSSVCFDPSMIEIFAPLSLGGCVILKQNLLEPFAPDECPTLIQGVPSVLDELARNGAIPDSVRVIHSGGEALSAAVARRIYRGSRAARLYNHYGPTEATVAATVQLVDRESVGDPSIGTAVGGARLHLLDETGRPVATGQTGELHIAGDGLARGYWQRPDLTGACFVPELDGPAGSRMYRTGDLARMTAAGELMFVGRRERQVKIRGCRVELGEVEQAVRALAQVDEAVVTLAADSARRDRLIAFVRAAPAFDGVAARGELARWLPRYMLPSRLVVVDDLPRSATGKADHAALAALVPAIPIDPANDAESSDSALERIVAETFATLLGVPAVGVDDDFFDLGGDSLAAFQLAMELEQRFGRPISPTIVAQASTARTLAALLDVTALCDEDHLCLLADGAGEQPVFCLPDVSGEPFSCMALAERLGRRCYGLSPGPLAAAFVADGDMAQLTTAYAAEVLRVQPEGPCIVLGYSFGGIEAFDLAVALERTGKSVTLVLIDGFLSRDLTAPAILVPWLLRDGLRYVREEGRAAMLHRLATSRWLPWGRADREVPSWIAPRRRALAEALSAATGRYEPQPFHGRTIMVAAGERNAFERLLDHDRHQGWRPWLRGEVAIRTVQATHNGLMRRPHVDETAAAVLAMLAEMEERSPQPEPAAVVEPPLILAGAARR